MLDLATANRKTRRRRGLRGKGHTVNKPIRRSVLAHNLRTWGALAWAEQRSKRPLLCRVSIHRPTVGIEDRVGVRLDSGVGVYDIQKGRRMCRSCGYQFSGKGPQNGGTE